jgi:hypothetical protein
VYKRITYTLGTLLAAASFACIEVDASGLEDAGETSAAGDEEIEEVDEDHIWTDLQCRYTAPGVRNWLARPSGSDDAWVLVVEESTPADAGWIETVGWDKSGCAAGSLPQTDMPEHRCWYIVDHANIACFAGGDGWVTQVDPVCAAEVGDGPAWPEWICGEAQDAGRHPWDWLACSDPNTACLALEGNAAMRVMPTCWVESLEPC